MGMKHYLVLIFGLLLFATLVHGRPIKVMVIDTGIDRTHKAFAGYTILCPSGHDCNDLDGHGTFIASIVLGGEWNDGKPSSPVCKSVELVVCNFQPFFGIPDFYAHCLQQAIDSQVEIVNMSLAGTEFTVDEYSLIKRWMPLGIKGVAAAGNNSHDLLLAPEFPAMLSHLSDLPAYKQYKNLTNIIPVGAIMPSGHKLPESNFGTFLKWELGYKVNGASNGGTFERRTGTSISTALHTHKLLLDLCKEEK